MRAAVRTALSLRDSGRESVMQRTPVVMASLWSATRIRRSDDSAPSRARMRDAG
jgi:hypothetical protein